MYIEKTQKIDFRAGKNLLLIAIIASFLTSLCFCSESSALPFGKAKDDEEPKEDAPMTVPAVKLTKAQQAEFDLSLKNANAYLKQENIDLAKICYMRCATLDPNSSDAHLGLAYCYVALKKPEQAQQEIFDSLRSDPNKAEARFLLGDLMMKDARWDEAGGQYLQILKQNTENLPARGNLATCFLMMGQIDPALGQYNYILNKDPKSSTAAYNLAAAYELKHSYNEAAQYYKKALQLDPDNTNALCSLAKCLIAKKQYQDAQVLLKEALKRAPKNHFAHLMQGFLFESTGEKTGAIQEYTKAVALAPKDGDSVVALERMLNGGSGKMKSGGDMNGMKRYNGKIGGLTTDFK